MTPDDLAQLRDLAERYAAGADLDDVELFTSVFLPDSRLFVHNPPGEGEPDRQRVGLEELSAVPGLLRRYDSTFHVIGNRRYRLSDDGTSATGFVYCIANHVTRSAGTNFVMHIRYDDTYRRAPEGDWRIAERHVRSLFTETRPVDPITG